MRLGLDGTPADAANRVDALPKVARGALLVRRSRSGSQGVAGV